MEEAMKSDGVRGNRGTQTRTDRIGTVENLLKRLHERQEQIAEACCGRVLPARIIRACAVLFSVPENRMLLNCTFESFFSALVECLSFGLLPCKGRGHFVQEGDKVRFIVGYLGMIQLAQSAGIFVKAFNVFQGDYFVWTAGADEWIEHRPSLEVERTPENLLCSYCVSKFQDKYTFDVMTKAEIDQICTKGRALSSAWKTDYLEMARKTVVRRASKFWPLKHDAAAICELDERNNTELESAEKE